VLRQQEDQLQAEPLRLEELLSERKMEMADAKLVRSYVDDLRDTLDNSPLSEQKSFIRSFVEDVKVTGMEVLLDYKMLLVPDEVNSKTAGVLDTVQYGGAGGVRTRYLLTASQALSQLSYSPIIPNII
jgi:site-specific DNA recombinase